MAFLKILFWVIGIQLALVILVMLFVLIALSLKVQLGFDYENENKRFWLKYGLIPIKVYPEMFTEEKKAKRAKQLEKLKSKFGPKLSTFVDKAKDKAYEKKEKKSAEKDLNDAVFIQQEEKRIESEEARLSVEIPEAEAEYEAAAKAQMEGNPFPDVVDEDEVSKLDDIVTTFKAYDIPGAIDSARDFISGFSFDSIIALLSYMSSKMGKTLGKVQRRVKIKKFRVGLVISGDDAAKTAIKYGTVAAIAYPALGKMASSMTVKDIALDMTPDYLANKDSGEMNVLVAFRPIGLITPFINMVPSMLKGVLSFRSDYKKTKKEKMNAKNGKKVEA